MYWVAVLAALGMIVSDVLESLLTQAQSRNRAHLAGLMDTAGWLVGIYVTNWSLEGIHSTTTRAVVVLAAVSAANYIGTYAGTKIGAKYVKVVAPLAGDVADHETRLQALEARWRLLGSSQ